MNNELMQELTLDIHNEFEEIRIFIADDDEFNFDELTIAFSNVNLVFGDRTPGITATAYYDNSTVLFAKEGIKKNRRVIIHELAHHLCYLSNSQGDSGPHCLEFAIINYCLLRKYQLRRKTNQDCYLQAYDIHEDKAYSSLSINPSRFDDLIRCIEFQSLSELCKKAREMAEKIRFKSTQQERKNHA